MGGDAAGELLNGTTIMLEDMHRDEGLKKVPIWTGPSQINCSNSAVYSTLSADQVKGVS